MTKTGNEMLRAVEDIADAVDRLEAEVARGTGSPRSSTTCTTLATAAARASARVSKT
jgi:cell division septum initiation protein DivIVA